MGRRSINDFNETFLVTIAAEGQDTVTETVRALNEGDAKVEALDRHSQLDFFDVTVKVTVERLTKKLPLP